MQTLLLDLRYALRPEARIHRLSRDRCLTLALGIGVTTAIFTLVYDVLLRPLPYTHAEKLVVMEEQVAEFRACLRMPLLILLAAVAGLLLVGYRDITNLLLSRAAGRRQQMAVAAALGASRAEMLHLAMRETILLATLGGALGILLAAILVPLMQRYLPHALDFRGSLHLDWEGAACALLLGVAATLLAGAAPAWISSQTQPQEVLHSESRLATDEQQQARAQGACRRGSCRQRSTGAHDRTAHCEPGPSDAHRPRLRSRSHHYCKSICPTRPIPTTNLTSRFTNRCWNACAGFRVWKRCWRDQQDAIGRRLVGRYDSCSR